MLVDGWNMSVDSVRITWEKLNNADGSDYAATLMLNQVDPMEKYIKSVNKEPCGDDNLPISTKLATGQWRHCMLMKPWCVNTRHLLKVQKFNGKKSPGL